MTKAEELIEECIVLEGRYEKKLALMLRSLMKTLDQIGCACRDDSGCVQCLRCRGFGEIERIANDG